MTVSLCLLASVPEMGSRTRSAVIMVTTDDSSLTDFFCMTLSSTIPHPPFPLPCALITSVTMDQAPTSIPQAPDNTPRGWGEICTSISDPARIPHGHDREDCSAPVQNERYFCSAWVQNHVSMAQAALNDAHTGSRDKRHISTVGLLPHLVIS